MSNPRIHLDIVMSPPIKKEKELKIYIASLKDVSFFEEEFLLPVSSGSLWGSPEMISITSDQQFHQEE